MRPGIKITLIIAGLGILTLISLQLYKDKRNRDIDNTTVSPEEASAIIASVGDGN